MDEDAFLDPHGASLPVGDFGRMTKRKAHLIRPDIRKRIRLYRMRRAISEAYVLYEVFGREYVKPVSAPAREDPLIIPGIRPRAVVHLVKLILPVINYLSLGKQPHQ